MSTSTKQRLCRSCLRLNRTVDALILCGATITISFVLVHFSIHHYQFESFNNPDHHDEIPTFSSFEISKADLPSLETIVNKCTNRPTAKPRLRNNVWHLTTGMLKNGTSLEISAFSAFCDRRNKTRVVRVLGVSNMDSSVSVHCQLWYSGQRSAVVVTAVVLETGRGYRTEGRFNRERMYTCELPSTVAACPESVSLAFEACDDERSTSSVPINAPAADMPFRHNIGICVAVLYGSVDELRLVEWIEFNRILGVTEFNFYLDRINPQTEKVLRYYTKLGVVRIRPVAPPIDKYCVWCLKLATIAVLNDCMYRNMYRYRYLEVIDVDEIIVPKMNESLVDLLKHLEGSHPGPSYVFINAYFFLELPSVVTVGRDNSSAVLTTATKLNRLTPSRAGYSSKSIIDPRSCEVVQNHFCVRRTPDVPARNWSLYVPTDMGLLHHYKNCHFQKANCTQLLKKYYTDDSAVRFQKDLMPRVETALAELGILHSLQSSDSSEKSKF